MKRYMLLALLTLCISCNEKNGEINPPSTNSLETEIINLTHVNIVEAIGWDYSSYVCELNNQEFDKAYLFNSNKEYREFNNYNGYIFRDTTVWKAVDFDTHSLITMTGLASSYILETNPTLSKTDYGYHLDVEIIVSEKERAARKWNLLLKAPKIEDGAIITSSVKTNKPLMNIMPDYIASDYYNKDIPSELTGSLKDYIQNGALKTYTAIAPKESPFFIIYKKENHQKVLDAVNAHPTASLGYHTRTTPAGPEGWYDDYYCNILFYCDYDDFIEPNSDIFQVERRTYVCQLNTTYSHIFPSSNWYCIPKTSHQADEGNPVYYLNKYLGLEVREGAAYKHIMFNHDKIHYWDYLSLIGRHYNRKSAIRCAIPMENAMSIEFGTQMKIKQFYDF